VRITKLGAVIETLEALGAGGTFEGGRVKIRVITLNLLHGAPIPGARTARVSVEQRLEWTGEHLLEERPDVVLLQEASISRRHGNTAATLARRLGMEFVYARANPTPLLRALGPRKLLGRLAFEEGPAVLSRLPIVEHRVHVLSPPLSPFERRVALEAVLEGPQETFSVFSVHLSAGSSASRKRQIASLVDAVEARPHPHPVIVGGDFNAEEHSQEIKLLTEIGGWIDSFRHLHGEAAGHTWGQVLADATATAGRRIDFLFAAPSGEERWNPSHSQLVLNCAFPQSREGVLWASDHYGVLTDFEAPSRLRNCAQ
jgi:endonuclease/exonuclease/phosphatase family metal-dependent hydrolase